MKPNEPSPRRNSSLEMTAVIPRDQLPPVSSHDLDELDLDPEHPETKELRARAIDPRAAPTLVPCPNGCKACACCSAGLVSVDRANEWRTRPSIAVLDEPGSEK